LHELAEQEPAKPKVKQSTETAAVVTGASARYLLLNESPVSAKLHELAEQEPAKTKEKQCLNC